MKRLKDEVFKLLLKLGYHPHLKWLILSGLYGARHLE